MIKDEELDGLLQTLLDVHGYDFTDYARASMKRRVTRLITVQRLASYAELLYRVKTDASFLPLFVEELTVNVTEMFRDPWVYKTLRSTVLPLLATHPFIRIWHAGCATGEEVYSMAILLQEANLLHKSLLYATDINPAAIANIKKGIFPLSQIKSYTENYLEAGGKKEFSSYYTAKYDRVKFDENLSSRMIVSTHNLVSDSSFNEFQLILCRNVLIYFDKALQDKVLELFDQSLAPFGFLVLGTKENIRFSPVAKAYRQVTGNEKIWRKIAN